MKKATLLGSDATQFDYGFGHDDGLEFGYGLGGGFGFKTGFGGYAGATGKEQTLVSAETEQTVTEDTTAATPVVEEATQTVTVTYSDEAISELLYMIEEEKLAGDVYDVFYDLYGLDIFKNIAESEDQHFSALINQAEQLGLDVDEFVLEPKGTFADEEIQELYDSMIATGSESATAALEVGLAIEEKDMVDIAAAIEDVEGTTLAKVYDNLLTGSSYHLEAFETALMI